MMNINLLKKKSKKKINQLALMKYNHKNNQFVPRKKFIKIN